MPIAFFFRLRLEKKLSLEQQQRCSFELDTDVDDDDDDVDDIEYNDGRRINLYVCNVFCCESRLLFEQMRVRCNICIDAR